MKTLKDIEDIRGKKVMVRLGLNVPIENGAITDDYRILQMMPTVDFLKGGGARVIIVSHIGREKNDTLKPVADYLSKLFPITFVENIMADDVRQIVDSMNDGDVVLFENLRQHDGEENNDPAFVAHLAQFADIYVNDAFPEAHREHASIVGLPSVLPAYAGLQFEQEVTNLKKAFDPEHPFVFILGGAKVETKLPLMKQFVRTADTIFVGGVLANDFLKAQGKQIGASMTSDEVAPLDITNEPSFMLPFDVVVLRDDEHVICSVSDIQSADKIFDAGPETINKLIEKIKEAKLVVWNGPLGLCEENFCDGTIAIASAIADSSAFSIVGGGDSLAAIPDDVQNRFSFVSTGGGSMLDLLANKTLPAIDALK